MDFITGLGSKKAIGYRDYTWVIVETHILLRKIEELSRNNSDSSVCGGFYFQKYLDYKNVWKIFQNNKYLPLSIYLENLFFSDKILLIP